MSLIAEQYSGTISSEETSSATQFETVTGEPPQRAQWTAELTRARDWSHSQPGFVWAEIFGDNWVKKLEVVMSLRRSAMKRADNNHERTDTFNKVLTAHGLSSQSLAEKNAHIYRSLPSSHYIRLLVLLPSAKPSNSIRCEICCTNLADNPSYEALSYVWGDGSSTRTIWVKRERFLATENLEVALRHLRLRHKHRVLWVDALCINQSDIPERNNQIKQMSKVYKQAQQTLVWLGRESTTTQDAFQFLLSLPALPKPISRHHTHLAELSKFCTGFRAVLRLLHREWWRRLWTLQETVLAREVSVLCGHHCIDWRKFSCLASLKSEIYDIFDKILMHRSTNFEGKELIQDMMITLRNKLWPTLNGINWLRAQQEKGTPVSLIQILRYSRHYCYSDSRDSVYALLGLVTDELDVRRMPKADYSITFKEVLWSIAEYLLQRYQNLDFLAWAVNTHSWNEYSVPVESLPSWIPDWRLLRETWPVNGNLRIPSGFQKPSLFDASLKSETSFYSNFTVVLMRLAVNYLPIDSLETILDSEITPTSAEKIVKSVISHERVESWKYMTGEPLLEAYWRTLLADQWEPDDTKLYEVQRIGSDEVSLPFSIPPAKEDSPALQKAIRARQIYWQDRRFFRTPKGYIGLAPFNSKPGDIVAIIFGASTPLLLRPNESGTGFILLGDW